MKLKLKPLAEQVMVITGASSGIGLVTAKLAAKRGARVLLVARNEAAMREAAAEIAASGGVADYAVADVGSHTEVRAAADKAIARFGRIDTWVNNAGVTIFARLVDTPADEHERLIRTNYFGTVHGALTAVEHLRERGGALIQIGSIGSDMPSPIMGAYAASKHAAKAYVEALRIELNADRVPISITVIKPAGIDTPIGEHTANHLEGEALVPPLVYDPVIVAEAILDAAQHPRLNVTVGGSGRLQVVLTTLFPGLLARFGGAMIPLMTDPKSPKTPTDNLAQAGPGGHERSKLMTARKTSFYTAANRHPALLSAAVFAGVGATVYAVLRGRSER